MARLITRKFVQIHLECKCGYNCVYEDDFNIRWRDLPAAQIRRKIDKTTGERFLLWLQKVETCESCNPIDY